MKATVFAPGSIGNVGPGFDVLGLAVGGLGDTVSVETGFSRSSVVVRGRDADLIPTDPAQNAASIAAKAMLRRLGTPPSSAAGPAASRRRVGRRDGARPAGGTPAFRITIDKGLPMSGGIGGSAASSVAGAYAAALACGVTPSHQDIILAALEGEQAVSGRHLDNIAPITLGGLVLSRSIEPLDVIRLPVPESWRVVLVRPAVRIETKKARAILPELWARDSWTRQMANTAALIHGFATADGALVRRAMEDLYAEPRRAPLIPNFDDIKRAALDAGAFGCSISGSGPTIFALADEATAQRCAEAMTIGECEVRVASIDRQGARPV
ncbi:MAG: homoserine kinase [Acidobacteriota bacterium]